MSCNVNRVSGSFAVNGSALGYVSSTVGAVLQFPYTEGAVECDE